jgi:hypothetical protein
VKTFLKRTRDLGHASALVKKAGAHENILSKIVAMITVAAPPIRVEI